MLAQQPLQRSLHIDSLAKRVRARPSIHTHNNANFDDGLRLSDPRVANPTEWRGRDVLLLVRDPRDILVSAYHHSRFRSGRFDGSLADFVRDPDRGIDKLLKAWNRWDEQRAQASRFEVASYDEMLADPAEMLRRSLQLIGVPIDADLLGKAVEFASFENMKHLEATNFFDEGAMRNRRGKAASAKVREGGTGGYRSHLSASDLAFISARCAEIGNPFERHWARDHAANLARVST